MVYTAPRILSAVHYAPYSRFGHKMRDLTIYENDLNKKLTSKTPYTK